MSSGGDKFQRLMKVGSISGFSEIFEVLIWDSWMMPDGLNHC